MKVLLVNPNQIQPPVVPIALDYISTALNQNSHKVKILDLSFSSDFQKEIKNLKSVYSPEIVGITIRNFDDCYFVSRDCFIPKIKVIVDCLKTTFEKPIVLGGTGFSIAPREVMSYLKPEFGIVGDGEVPLLSLLKYLDQPKMYKNIPGLAYFDNNVLKINEKKYFDLNRFELYKRNFVNNHVYYTRGGMGAIETKRGCPQKCIYCIDPIVKGSKYRLRNPKNVVKEIKCLLSQKIDCYHLCDSEFNLPYKHAVAICKEIICSKLGDKIQWYTYACPKPFTSEFADLMKHAGCVGINFGVDSGNNKILKILCRDFNTNDISNTANICRKSKIVFMYDLLLGAPTETKDTVKHTIEFMKIISPDRIGCAFGIRIYPGTGISKMLSDGKLDLKDISCEPHPNNMLTPVFYFPKKLQSGFIEYLSALVGKDQRFFVPLKTEKTKNYNYNANKVLVNAIKKGYKGAFWDILRKVQLSKGVV